MRKHISALVAMLLVMAGAMFALAVTTAPANATQDGDCEPTEDTFSAWSWSHYTDWQESDVAPADPDGQAGEDNPLNLVQIGEREQREVGNGDGTEDETVTVTKHFSYTGGPIEGTPAPPTDADGDENWQPNAEQEPPGHLNSTNAPGGGAYTGSGLHYASHGSSGLADWFYFGSFDTVIPGEDETFHTEYRWSVYERTFTPGEDCPEDPTPVVFAFSDPTPPTCEQAGSFLQEQFPGVTVTVEPAIDGPGEYTLTATLDDPVNTTFPDGTTEPKVRVVEVLGALGFQSSDPEADCYVAEQPDPIVQEASSSAYECGDDFETVTTTVTTTEYVSDGEGGWVLGEPVVEETSEQVAHEVVACDTPEEPNEPNEPNEPVIPTSNVPTSVDAGLVSMPETASPDQSVKFALLAGSGLLVMLAASMSLVAARRSGTEK